MKESEGIPLGTVVAGRYRVRNRLGEGGMGSVYAVEHVHTGQELALKVLNAKMVKDQISVHNTTQPFFTSMTHKKKPLKK